jgi:hypothetical protein
MMSGRRTGSREIDNRDSIVLDALKRGRECAVAMSLSIIVEKRCAAFCDAFVRRA